MTGSRSGSAATAITSADRARAALTMVAGVAAFAALTALGARAEVRLPFTPVPLTLQVMTVLLAGFVLGPRAGFASQAAYLAVGAAGLPVFAGGASGPWHLAGPTAGYLWAMPVAAWLAGSLAASKDSGLVRRFGAAIAGVALVHVGGLIGLSVWLGATGASPARAFTLGSAPFVLPGVLKAAAAAGVDRLIRKG